MKRQILKLDESNRRLRDEAQAVELKLGKDGYLLNQLEDLKSKNMKLNKNVESKSLNAPKRNLQNSASPPLLLPLHKFPHRVTMKSSQM